MCIEENLSLECWRKVQKWVQQDSAKKVLSNIHMGYSTLLHEAVKLSDLEMIDALMKSGVDIKRANIYRESPLHAAVASKCPKSTEVLKVMLSNGADVNDPHKSIISPFHSLLILGNHIEQVKLFLEYGADIYRKNRFGRSAIHFAAHGGKVETLRLILDSGADVNEKGAYKDTALQIAAEQHHIKCVELLLSRGADVNALSVSNRSAFDSLTSYENCREPKYDSKKTKELMRLFVDRSANMSFKCLPKRLFKFERKIILQELAKFQELNLPIDEACCLRPLLEDSEWNRSYFNKCTRELKSAKIFRIYDDTWVTYWHLIVGTLDDLRKYAENDDLMQAFEEGNCKRKFPNYNELIQRNVRRGIEARKSLDAAVISISQCFPIKLPTLVLRKIIGYVGVEYSTL